MRIRLRLLGLLLVLLGAWGGIVAYVGPLFGYRMTPGPAWNWTTSHWELHAAPGAAVVVGGLLVLLAAPRIIARLGAILAMAGGAWLIVGPLFASLWLGANSETQLASASLHQAARPLGFHYGTGLLIVAVAAYAWGACQHFMRRGAAYPAETPADRPSSTVRRIPPGEMSGDDELTSILARHGRTDE
ncbi:MAG TPA: hypothetical protein VFH54_15890 [Mycobacteriales bacterium]|nr:hypothetical protein [Mycobacteriales bacterium]